MPGAMCLFSWWQTLESNQVSLGYEPSALPFPLPAESIISTGVLELSRAKSTKFSYFYLAPSAFLLQHNITGPRNCPIRVLKGGKMSSQYRPTEEDFVKEVLLRLASGGQVPYSQFDRFASIIMSWRPKERPQSKD